MKRLTPIEALAVVGLLLFLALWLVSCGGSVTEEPLPQADGGTCPAGFGAWYGGLCAASMPEAECPPTAIYTKGLCAVRRVP